MPELISICIPTYRRPSHLLHALHSCLTQDYRPLEILIGDDSPNDDSRDLVSSIGIPDDVTMNYVKNVPALGQAANVNSLFARACGKWILLLHDDDVLVRGSLTLMHDRTLQSSRIVAVYGRQDIISETGEIDQAKSEDLNTRYKRTEAHAGVTSSTVLSALWRQFPNDGYLVDADIARAVGYRLFDEVGESCDTDFGVRLGLYTRDRAFFFVNTTTCRYRLSANALSGSRDISWRFYDFLMKLNGELLPDEVRARDALLTQIAVQALIENAVHGHRRAALGILRSRFYPRKRKGALVKSLYHLALIAVPQLDKLRRRARKGTS